MEKEPLLATYFPLVKAVAAIKSKKNKRLILKQLSKDAGFAGCLREIAKNIIAQDINLEESDKKKLNKHSKIVRHLANSKKIEQSGGFLNIAVPILASIVSEIIRNAKH